MASPASSIPFHRNAVLLTRDLLKLSKYRLSGLVAFTAGVGYACRYDPQDEQNPTNTKTSYYRTLFSTTAGTWLAAASANTMNQMYEIRSDALMNRTRLRPLPSGRIGLAQALLFAITTGVSGVSLLAYETNTTAAALAAANIALYAGVYTPLKPISTINTWIGAVVGAIPPMLGWSAASNGQLLTEREQGAWALGSLLFLWQIPHFHALAVVSRKDYANGGLKMLAVTNPVANAMWARITAAMMIPLGYTFVATGVATFPFAIESALLASWMYKGAGQMMMAPTAVQAARPLFKASIFHLPLTLGLLLAHNVPYDSTIVQPQLVHYPQKEMRFHQPWEVIAPFPFLPVPCSVPAVVMEIDDERL